ncbi:malto-oligosyltrehalose synthase [Rhizobium sp. SGZ-381]|uniref:malto-oligosyltrehalose synthase n=1 Tax=Rhizobium sp. SGZ-381 TaxID=3342800 RepID=UPI00366F5089
MTIPSSTYRIQFRNGMTFDRAVELVPYLNRMGISHLYASPIFTAAEGSTHGYDVADANEIAEEIGGREGFERLSAALKDHGLGLILDIVPNHMAAALENRWWRSIIEWGKESAFSHFFDVNWQHRLTLPVLGDDFGTVAEKGDLTVSLDTKAACLTLSYFDSHYPLSPATYDLALQGIDLALADKIRAAAVSATPAGEEDFHETMRRLCADPEAATLAQRLKDRALGPEKLAALHEAQPYRLMNWRDAPSELSYRRFFEITGLAGLRVETEEVFLESHRLILDLVRSGKVDGLRIDHVDGLADPRAYLQRLREAVGPACYLVVEKILAHGERLPSDWPVSGTTGYEFIASLSDVLAEPQNLAAFHSHYSETLGRPLDLEAEMHKAKGLMVDVNFAGEVSTLLSIALAIVAGHEDSGRFGDDALREALRALLIAFPVYRTYGTALGLEPADSQRLSDVLSDVRAGENPPQPQPLGFLARILVGDVSEEFDARAAEFRTRFQQLTGPLMAKSLEDTLFFRINPLIALNEVGGEPLPPLAGLAQFHDEMQSRLEDQPHGLSASSTHDTKRGEDARARLYALSEAPDLWREAFNHWRQMNGKALRQLDAGAAPEPELEWLIYQALIGVWPHDLAPEDTDGLKALEERFVSYLEKSLREAKLRTSWNDPDSAYEEAVIDYARHLLGPDGGEFRRDFVARMKPVFAAGGLNSITQTLIKLAAPGIPDIYQGSEGTDLSLVDPDNRRAPDFTALMAGLDCSCDPADPEAWLDGRLKQRLIATILPLRDQWPDLFLEGDYVPLDVSGSNADHLVAFARRQGDKAVIIVAPRLMLRTLLADTETQLPSPALWTESLLKLDVGLAGHGYRDLLTDAVIQPAAELRLGDLLARQPFCVLISA